MSTNMEVAFQRAFEKDKEMAEQYKTLGLSTVEKRHLKTFQEIDILLKDKTKWEDPAYGFFNIIREFVTIVSKYYYTSRSIHHQKRLLKNLSKFDNKYSTFCMLFSWNYRLYKTTKLGKG